jgi:dihydrosphingosine 1-phosphate phosphatase
MQDKMRSPALDSYFAITANLGTHTFFMVVLPILFWCGYTSLGRGMVHILASGVFFTGFIKDMFSLPRPLSPPLHRITMSGSAALEYGFPSTHSANAVSVAVYALFTLHSPDCALAPATKLFLEGLSYSYAFSIILGRLYCGMHGFLDVIIGSLMGASISVIECVYGADIDNYLHNSSWRAPLLVAAIIIILVRIHPEPADDCPCFDDSVAFAGVMIGCELGDWHYSTSSFSWSYPVPATVPFSLDHLGWPTAIIRVLVGVFIIFVWREVMKPAMLKSLPHLFRFIEQFGLILPRKFFMPASEYKKIPASLRVDNVMPSVSDLPSLLTSIRHPGRGRAVSIGPQSAADAYETLAYRDKRRRESMGTPSPSHSRGTSTNKASHVQNVKSEVQGQTLGVGEVTGLSSQISLPNGLPTPAQSRLGSYEQMMGQGHVIVSPPTPNPEGRFPEELNGRRVSGDGQTETDILIGTENELGEKEMFSRLEKPRVRYDVEVVTKLVVYTGTIPLQLSHDYLTSEEEPELTRDRNRMASGRDQPYHLRTARPRNEGP